MKSFSEMTVAQFISQAASDAPVPGGGGIAALAGALGGSMASMAANFTVGKVKFAEHEGLMRDILGRMAVLIEDFKGAVDDDAQAFSSISDAYKLPRANDEEKALRKTAIDSALAASMKVPLRVVRCCGEAAGLLPGLAKAGNPNLLSDVEVAAIMLEASARAALVNVYANSRSLKTDEARDAEREGEELVRRIVGVAGDIRTIVAGRG